MALDVAICGCREPFFFGRAYLVNRTDADLLVDLGELSGRCDVIWKFGTGWIREDDFSGAAATYRIPPGKVAPLGALSDCAVRVGIEGERDTLTWDPALPVRAIHDPPRADDLADHRQLVDVVRKNGRLSLELPKQVVRMPLLPAESPGPQSACPEAQLPRLGYAVADGVKDGVVERVERRDGCVVVHLPSSAQVVGWQEQDAGAAQQSEDDAGVPLGGRTSPQPLSGLLQLCVPEELFPFAAGDELTISTNGAYARESGIVVTRHDNGVEHERLGLFENRGRPPRLPATGYIKTVLGADGAPVLGPLRTTMFKKLDESVEVAPSRCGLLRDDNGVLWQSLELRIDRTRVVAGQSRVVNGVTYYLGRALRPVFGSVELYDDRIEWLELHP